jgi:hypothetical protein
VFDLHSTLSRCRRNGSLADVILAFVAGVLSLAWLLAVVSWVPLLPALAAGSLPAGGAIGYALFYEPPTA